MTALIAIIVVVLILLMLSGSLLDHAEAKVQEMIDRWEAEGKP